jgi:hypothetical protein
MGALFVKAQRTTYRERKKRVRIIESWPLRFRKKIEQVHRNGKAGDKASAESVADLNNGPVRHV